MVIPAGDTLGFHYHQPKAGDTFKQNQARWIADTLTMLDDAAKKSNLPPRTAAATNPFPDRGVGPTQGGGVRLAVTVTATRGGRPTDAPVHDSFVLTAPEWAAFAPPADKRAYEVPAVTAGKFAPVLSPLTDSIFVPRPKDVTTATVTAEVVRSDASLAVVKYAGTWASKHLRDGDAKFPITATMTGEGVGVVDAKTGKMQSLLWVLAGTYQKGPGAPATPTAAVVEWKQ